LISLPFSVQNANARITQQQKTARILQENSKRISTVHSAVKKCFIKKQRLNNFSINQIFGCRFTAAS